MRKSCHSEDEARREEQRAEDLRANWRERVAQIGGQVRDLIQGDTYFRRSMTLLEDAGRPANPVYQWILATYGRDVAVGLRRLLDTSKGTWSLRRLLDEIRHNSAYLSRDDFVRQYTSAWRGKQGWIDTANKVFTRLVGGEHVSIPADEVASDLEKLAEAFGGIGLERLANVRIVHFSAEDTDFEAPKWEQVHDAVRLVGRVCWRYYFLLHRVEPGHETMWHEEPDLDLWLREFWLGKG